MQSKRKSLLEKKNGIIILGKAKARPGRLDTKSVIVEFLATHQDKLASPTPEGRNEEKVFA